MNYNQQAFAIANLFENEVEVTNEPQNENEISFANELRNEIRNEVEMNSGNEPKMNVEMNVKKIVEMNRRTTTTVPQVIQLKKNCNYSNFTATIWYGNKKYWIEGTFYKGTIPVYHFRINCKSKQDSRIKLNQIRRCYQ